jgi:uncharacterized radical SAM superfamily Fe-S cluster-containing enzyme
LATRSKQTVRGEVLHEMTRSLCPECGLVIDAQVLIRDQAVYMRKRCPNHGWHEALVSTDVGWHLSSIKYNKPGAIPYSFATSVRNGCPSDCGLCPEHQQHTCVGIIDITTRCNMLCPTCFADAGRGHDLTVSQVETILDRLIDTEGQPEVVQISGGEPTIHPQLFDILDAASSRGIRCVMLNTNGIKLAQDADFAGQLAAYRPVIYLQFDGVTSASDEALRGRDLRDIKRKALDNIAEAGLWAVLVATVALGVNDNEIGDILSFGLEHPAVLGVNYQPVAFTGRCQSGYDPLRRITLPDVLHALEAQTEGAFRMSDFRPIPCPHPSCSATTYAFVDGKRAIPITRFMNVDDHLSFLTNRTFLDISSELQQPLEDLWSMAAAMGSDRTAGDLACVACDINLKPSTDTGFLKEHFFVVNVHGFMDRHTFDQKRLMKCCVHQLLPDGRAVPFCAYNNLGYRQTERDSREVASDREESTIGVQRTKVLSPGQFD